MTTTEYSMTFKEWIFSGYLTLGFVIQFLMLFFFGNWYDLDFLVYLGWGCFVVAFILFFSANELRIKGGMEGKSYTSTTKLVDTGIYGLIRHPIYLSLMFLTVGFALLSQHLLSVFFGITLSVCLYYIMLLEEKATTERFGKAYVRYMEKVPRINLIVGFLRWLSRRRNTT